MNNTPYFIAPQAAQDKFGNELNGRYLMAYGLGMDEPVLVGSKDRTRMYTKRFCDSIIHPTDAHAEFCKRFATVHFAGTPNQGSAMLTAELDTKALLGEEHKVHLFMYTSCTHQRSTIIGLRYTRVRCMNQLPGIYKAKGYFFSAKHSTLDHNMTYIESLLDQLPIHLRNYEQQRQNRMETKLSLLDFMIHMREYLDSERVWDDKQVTKLNTTLYTAFNHQTNANLPVSLERGVQAITWLNSHGFKLDGTKSRGKSVEAGLKSEGEVVSLINYLDKRVAA
jgi:hypothetical protein